MKVKFSHPLENVAGSLCVGPRVRRGNKEIVHVDDKPSLSNHVSERVIHESLEYGGGIVKAKEHNGGFEESFVSDEGCLPLMAILDVDIIVSPMNVELCEVVSVFQLIHKVGDEREGVGIVGGMFVEVSVVLTGVEFAVLLFDKEERGHLREVGRMDLSSG